MLAKKLAAVAAISMITASTAAVAQTAAPSVAAASTARAGAPAQGSNELVGTTAWILAAIALGLIVWGIIELTDDDGESP
jgi:hypothetical protein